MSKKTRKLKKQLTKYKLALSDRTIELDKERANTIAAEHKADVLADELKKLKEQSIKIIPTGTNNICH